MKVLRTNSSDKLHLFSSVTVMALLLVLSSDVSANGYAVQKVRAPGVAVRMSSAGYLTGTYKVKCSKIPGVKPQIEVCYYAPWIYNGQSIIKVQWPIDWNLVYSLGINDSLELVGREYRGSLTAGGWLYSDGVVNYSGSLPGGGGSLLAAINNNGVAVGTGQTSDHISRAVTFQNNGDSYVLTEVPVFDDSSVPTNGVDINDMGDITGTYTMDNGSQYAYVFLNGNSRGDNINNETIDIPELPGTSYCQALRISQLASNGQLWVAGNCGDRGFIYQVDTRELTELYNISGQSGGVSVQSVNSFGVAVGTVAGKAVMWAPGNQTAIDLNQFAPNNVTFTRGTDINDAGTILAVDIDLSGNMSNYLLSPLET